MHQHLEQLAENLWTVTELLTPGECEQLIARGEGIGFEAATVPAARPRGREEPGGEEEL